MSIVVGTLILALFGVFYPTNSGNIYAACIALYALTSGLYFFYFSLSIIFLSPFYVFYLITMQDLEDMYRHRNINNLEAKIG